MSVKGELSYTEWKKPDEEDFPEGFFEKPRRHATEKKDIWEEQTINMVDDSIVLDFVKDPASYYYGLVIRNLLLGNYEEARRYLNKLIAYETVKED